MAVVKGKQGTKGQKQIVQDNKSTINFYLMFSAIPLSLYAFLMCFFWSEDFFSTKYIIFFSFSALVNVGSVYMMKYMAKVSYSATGALIDGGIDLNMEGGFAEYFKDAVILNTIILFTSLYSTYFWLLWLSIPGTAVYKFVTGIFLPWIFAPAPEVDEEKDEKKARKMDRRMRRSGM